MPSVSLWWDFVSYFNDTLTAFSYAVLVILFVKGWTKFADGISKELGNRRDA